MVILWRGWKIGWNGLHVKSPQLAVRSVDFGSARVLRFFVARRCLLCTNEEDSRTVFSAVKHYDLNMRAI